MLVASRTTATRPIPSRFIRVDPVPTAIRITKVVRITHARGRARRVIDELDEVGSKPCVYTVSVFKMDIER